MPLLLSPAPPEVLGLLPEVCHDHQCLANECGCEYPRCTEYMPALVKDGKLLVMAGLCGARLMSDGYNLACPYEMEHVLGLVD